MIKKYIDRSLHILGLNHSQKEQTVLDHTLRGNGSMLRKTVIPGERIEEEKESEDTDGTDTASTGDIGESSDKLLSDISSPDYGIPLSPVLTRSFAKAKKTKDRGPFYKGYEGRGVVYLPGDISGLTKKLHLLAAEFFADNITVRNELVYVLDALLRLKRLTRKEFTDITARVAASLRLYTRVDVLQ